MRGVLMLIADDSVQDRVEVSAVTGILWQSYMPTRREEGGAALLPLDRFMEPVRASVKRRERSDLHPTSAVCCSSIDAHFWATLR